MKLIIRSAKIIDSKSPFHNKTVDILIVDGFIKKRQFGKKIIYKGDITLLK